MADYIKLFDDESSIPIVVSDDRSPDDVPLLNENGKDHHGQQGSRCFYGQKGFRHPTADLQSIKAQKQLLIATVICTIFMIAELIGGYLAGSLAVITDAAHLLSDCISFIVALCAIWLAKRPADEHMSFGYKRVEVAGAVVSILGIWALTGVLIYLAILRTINWDFDIDANTMIIISSVGVAFNVAMAIVLHGSCSSVLHAHSHTHDSCDSDHTKKTLAEAPRARLDVALPNPLSLHSSSFMTTHSRHNSFSKASGCNGAAVLDDVIDMQATEIRRESFDVALGRSSSDGRTFSHNCHPTEDYAVLELNGSAQRFNEEIDLTIQQQEGFNRSNKSNKNINVRAAMIHIIGDFIQSIGVLIAAIIIKIFPSAKVADPICTFIFSIIVMFTTFHIIKDAVLVLLDAVPKNLNLTRLEREIYCIDGVKSVHHLNVWSLSTDLHVMSVHLIIDHQAKSDKVLKSVTSLARDSFNIQHVTCQIERCPGIIDSKPHNLTENGPDVTL
ncbi:proton-coupled zinc antiporter SLC30A2-like [Phlebotomus argentipes]|uniref:proton-coupled zinc antiporter SLC30A2-like n=1 Tax=Phlebotomus argentipes TaxID=94469 RepID=UPI002892EFC8|nr:proton-coupled zinc antiporter SLC30A2-like [Phlebotomus argentipes]XP_059611215.1 proton-coupled zinc antiporter SLC30A2-like [Phlebotomus argentipes]XP_059611216.1 proton-coupled zinc antiporter SLC30A2-like [Phlebotomus argentipes]XP_059611217.1 proton-coupled zinc antiporter SLC30A2-like [Phlebotomus argentipes]XP_059611218.1 proton-coupled zinc antiporter SLC30A2-like [Phlebotomus argentipes]XP_059611219.1 proton-coupled zinc antiporter SLC30A2-like [Phlebotomus argentipes]